MKKSNAPPLVDIREWELIRLAKTGDDAAFSELAGQYSRQIFNIGLRMLGSREDASDMTQDVLLKVYRHLAGFRGDSAFSTWIYRISVNTCRDMLRSAYRQRERVFSDFSEEDGDEPFSQVADYSALPEQLLLDGEADLYLTSLIDGLSPKYRLVISLRDVSGLSYQEIAAATGISVGTVKSRLNRARAAMRQQAEADAEHFPAAARLMGKGGQEDAVR